eukprot:13329314-Alexandrium_andersonii.AAC.1
MMRVDDAAIIGSCSWTTASRANNEVGALIDFNAAGRERLEAMFEEWMASSTPLREALKEHSPDGLAGGGDCDRCSACTEC